MDMQLPLNVFSLNTPVVTNTQPNSNNSTPVANNNPSNIQLNLNNSNNNLFASNTITLGSTHGSALPSPLIFGPNNSVVNQPTPSTAKEPIGTAVLTGNDITITITPIGIQVYGLPPFLMRKHTLFKRLFTHVATRFSMDENELIFTFNDRICPNQCPNDIGLENGDTIVVRKVSLKKKISFDSKQINFSGFVENISSLYDSQHFSDIAFKLTDNSTLYAHKNILSSRCSKFKAMFQGDMIESTKKEIDIVDHKPYVFRKMIEYLYTDSLNEENCEMVLQLIIIADEYILDSLKNLCESKLILEINHINVSNFFIQSDIYSCKNLKKASLDHILTNIKKLVPNKEFEGALTESPTLLYEIVKEMAPHFDINLLGGKKRKDFFEFNNRTPE